jgi:hypothetical protein
MKMLLKIVFALPGESAAWGIVKSGANMLAKRFW